MGDLHPRAARGVTLEDLSIPVAPGPDDWNNEGVVILPPGTVDDGLIEAYEAEWLDANGPAVIEPNGHMSAERPGGWPHCTPYRENPALLALCCYPKIAETIEGLIGEPAGVHLNLTGWVTTARRWHQDTYLNPEFVGDKYAAVWVALGDVDENSGPFQYIPGSHRWHRLMRALVAPHVDMNDPDWPQHTEDFLTPLVEARIEDGVMLCPGAPCRGINCETCLGEGVWPVEVRTHLPKKGEVLIWHSRLYHQGSPAQLPGAYRPALIFHVSGIRHRWDMPPPVQHSHGGGWFFPIDGGKV